VIKTGISISWLSDEDLNTHAQWTINRTWTWLRATSQWQEWLSAHVPPELFVSVNFEDREAPKSLIRTKTASRPTLTYYAPYRDVQAAVEARNLKSYASEVYRDVYRAWARKNKLPEPPTIDDAELSAIPSRLP
jgi:hypothetical protein